MMTSGVKSSLAEVAPHRVRHRFDIGGVVVIAGGDAHRRLPAHFHERAEGLIGGRRRRRRGVLRIERHQQDAIAALVHQRADAAVGRRIGVAHGEVDLDAVGHAERDGELLGLRARDGLERALVALVVPDGLVVLAFAARAHGEDDQVEDRPPLPARHLDDALVGEELLEVAAHRPIVGAVGRAEVEQQHADAPAAHVRVARRPVARDRAGTRWLA